MPNLTNSQEPEPGVFWPLGAGAARKKYQEPEPLWEKIRSRSRLKTKSGAGAAKTLAGSSALKNILKRKYVSMTTLKFD